MKAFHDEKAVFEAERMKCNIEAENALDSIRKRSAALEQRERGD